MKIIVASYSKTGTKTLNAALRTLGYDVYDFVENFWYLGDDWMRIMNNGGEVGDFKRMYKDVDVALDIPVYFFWEEIHQAFPDAKIILTVRDDESWCKSLDKQLEEMSSRSSPLYVLVQLMTYTGFKYYRWTTRAAEVCLGARPKWFWQAVDKTGLIQKHMFRQHNVYVQQVYYMFLPYTFINCITYIIFKKAPKDKLLVYNLADGWEPLCQFLGKQVPDQVFPRMNVGATLVANMMAKHPVMKRMQKEFKITMGVISILMLYGGYKVFKGHIFHAEDMTFMQKISSMVLNYLPKIW
ncbi:uncharacterized protein LOC100175117 [Ciona intestinalis]